MEKTMNEKINMVIEDMKETKKFCREEKDQKNILLNKGEEIVDDNG